MNWMIDHSDLPGFIRVTVDGAVSLERFKALWDDLCSHEKWQPGTSVLMDNRKLDRIGSDGLGLMAGAAEYFGSIRDEIGDARVAVISGHREHFMHARQFQYAIRNRRSAANVQIFFDEEEAVEWLRRFSNGSNGP
jgi:hypothetical protein